jgi:hypothetical protein
LQQHNIVLKLRCKVKVIFLVLQVYCFGIIIQIVVI